MFVLKSLYMKKLVIHIMSAFALTIGGLIAGFIVGMGAINWYPDQCFDGQCFTFFHWVGYEATGMFGSLVGALLGLLVYGIILVVGYSVKLEKNTEP